MATSDLLSNGDYTSVKPLNTDCFSSEVQNSRLPLPSVFKKFFHVCDVAQDGPPSSTAGDQEIRDRIRGRYPYVFGQPSAVLFPCETENVGQSLKVGVVLSGPQAPGEHNVISGIYDYLQDHCKGSTLYGFRGGIMKCKHCRGLGYTYPFRNQYMTASGRDMVETPEQFEQDIETTLKLDHNGFVVIGGDDSNTYAWDKIETPEQFEQVEEIAIKLDLDGLLVIGGYDSNSNACVLADNFRSKKLKTRVIGCPKTIDGDLKCKEVPVSFGFDTVCKMYVRMIKNVMVDVHLTGKYHFVRLMGRSASHITLECALQTHPNITLIGEEIAAEYRTLKSIVDYIANIIAKRAESGYNYGVVLIPEGLIDFIPQFQQLIFHINEILAIEVGDAYAVNKIKLPHWSRDLLESLPKEIEEQLLDERDPHGHVAVAKIETEKMLIQMVETELDQRAKAGSYKGQFKGQSHVVGHQGRCGLPSSFDSAYCYTLGYAAGALLQSGKTGLITSVGNLSAPVEEWSVGGTALTSLMDFEWRRGTKIKKAMVELEAAPFKKFASLREDWAVNNRYVSPGPIDTKVNHTLLLELGAEA